MRASAAIPSSAKRTVNLLGAHQRAVLPCQGVVGFRQDAHEIGLGQRPQFDPNRQTPLQFRQQIRRFGHMERARAMNRIWSVLTGPAWC